MFIILYQSFGLYLWTVCLYRNKSNLFYNEVSMSFIDLLANEWVAVICKCLYNFLLFFFSSIDMPFQCSCQFDICLPLYWHTYHTYTYHAYIYIYFLVLRKVLFKNQTGSKWQTKLTKYRNSFYICLPLQILLKYSLTHSLWFCIYLLKWLCAYRLMQNRWFLYLLFFFFFCHHVET